MQRARLVKITKPGGSVQAGRGNARQLTQPCVQDDWRINLCNPILPDKAHTGCDHMCRETKMSNVVPSIDVDGCDHAHVSRPTPWFDLIRF